MSIALPLIWCLVSYAVGCMSWAGFLARRLKNVDLRTIGSGNLGATNAARVLGRKWAVGIYFLDFGKGALAAGAPLLFELEETLPIPLAVLSGLLAVLGHVFPVHLGFKGGKGVATASGVILFLAPWSFVAALGTWIVSVGLTRIVSVGSVLAAVSLPVSHAWLQHDNTTMLDETFVLFLSLALLVTVLHRSNIKRILAGEEDRIGDNPDE